MSGKLIYEIEYVNGKKWNGKFYSPNDINNYYELKNGKGFIKKYSDNGIYVDFEGEYLNGEKNGKGKQFYYAYDELEFEGEYLNGEKWTGKYYNKNNTQIYELKDGKGFIKEYHSFINVKFEGEYLNGEKNRKGKEYNKLGELKFEGEYINGKREGIGKEYDENKLVFEGEYKNGEKNGKGKEYNKNGELIFEGDYSNGKRNGKGKEYENNKLIFEGEFLYGYRIRGKEYVNEKLIYEGNYIISKDGTEKIKTQQIIKNKYNIGLCSHF